MQRWIGVDGGNLATPIQLSDLGAGASKIVFASALVPWLPSAWISTLQKLHGALESRGVGFAVIQTVFEGAHENTFEKLRINQVEYNLPIAGHDEPPAGAAFPTFMEDYRTRGTPWFTVINANGRIVFLGFSSRRGRLVAELEST